VTSEHWPHGGNPKVPNRSCRVSVTDIDAQAPELAGLVPAVSAFRDEAFKALLLY
jgi:hypothetical protein